MPNAISGERARCPSILIVVLKADLRLCQAGKPDLQYVRLSSLTRARTDTSSQGRHSRNDEIPSVIFLSLYFSVHVFVPYAATPDLRLMIRTYNLTCLLTRSASERASESTHYLAGASG